MEPFFESKHEAGIMASEHASGCFVFPAHFHRAVELAYCLSGRVRMRIGSEECALAPGDLALVLPDIVHSYDTPWQDARFVLTICAERLLSAQQGELVNHAPRNQVLRAHQVHENAAYALRALPRAAREHPEAAQLLFQLVLAHALPYAQLSRGAQARSSDMLNRLVSYMSENFAEPMTLGSLAATLGEDRYQLSRAFSKKLGASFSQYLRSLRVARAKDLLATTDLPITRICYDCGFESQRTFNRAFSQGAGVSPGAYRRGAQAREGAARGAPHGAGESGSD